MKAHVAVMLVSSDALVGRRQGGAAAHDGVAYSATSCRVLGSMRACALTSMFGVAPEASAPPPPLPRHANELDLVFVRRR